MRALLYTALMACTPLAMADISMGSAAAAPAAKTESIDNSQYVKTANEVFAAVRELTSVLKGIKDQASADTAAPQVSSFTNRLIELQKNAESMPRPDAEVEQLVRNNMNMVEVQQTVKDFMEAFINIGMNNAYGSHALMDALEPVVNTIPGGQE